MTKMAFQSTSTAFKIGWWILFGLNAWSALGQLVFIFIYPAESMFAFGTVFHLAAAALVLIPYRRAEKWAWYLVWIFLIPMVMVFFNDPTWIGTGYLVAALAMAAGQVLTLRVFFITKK
jgi:hypothetical protein